MLPGRLPIATLVLLAAGSPGQKLSDPAHDLVRTRIIISTTAPAVEVALETGVIASQQSTVVTGLPSVRLGRRGNALRIFRNTPGQTVEGQFQIVAAGISAGQPVRWSVAVDPPGGGALLEIYNLNREDRPALVDRVNIDAPATTFTSPAAALRVDGPLETPQRIGRPLVLAHYYPWYTRESWSSSELLDRPLQPYSTEDVADVARSLAAAKSAGLDAMIVSWQGKDVGGGWNDRRMRVVLDAAARAGLQVSAYLETLAANPQHIEGVVPTDPDTVFEWIADLVDLYSSHRSYLRLNDRPVVFVFAASRLTPATWQQVICRLRASGRNPLLIGESTDSRWLDAFEGEYRYINVDFAESELSNVYQLESLRVRTHHLLTTANGPRRIWAATVSPGFDDSGLVSRSVHFVRDRANGSYYEAQWKAALASAADWILVTSWNEWWENTEIEPSQRYGAYYVGATRPWALLYRQSFSEPREHPRNQVVRP